MSALIILDNTYSVPPNVAGIFGLDSFAELIIRKRSLRQRLSDLSRQLGWDDVVVIDGGALRGNVSHRIERLQRSGGRVIYIPSYVHLAAPDADVKLFLEKLSYAMQSVLVRDGRSQADWLTSQGAAPQIHVLRDQELQTFLSSSQSETRQAELLQMQPNLADMTSDVALLDLRSTEEFLHAVTSTFDARHFNRVSSQDRYTITKFSTNVEKLKQEYDYYSLLPARMRRFFIEPFDFQTTEQGASYRMERLLIPDFALQWLHNSVRTADFEQFVRHIFYFLGERGVRRSTPEEARSAADLLYVDKVVDRVRQLQQQDGFKGISAQAELAFQGVQSLLERYLGMYRKLAPQRSYDQCSIIHGDLCFSNILYNGALATLKLIDPRGAIKTSDLYADPFYDLAKLSHSIEGRYDYINAGQYSIELDTEGKPSLKVQAPPRNREVEIFRNHCKHYGASPRLIRLYEASLFISMTPLHIESPLKVLAFLLNAHQILQGVEDETLWSN